MIQSPYPTAIRSILTIVLFTSVVVYSVGQNVTETRWYFGNSADNLIFDRNGRNVEVQTDQAVPFGAAGAVTITDQFTGNLLFYTDGVNVYDVSHGIVPNGTGLAGNSAINVPAVTCPDAVNPGRYYLFTNSGSAGANEILVSTLDANEQGNGTAQFPYGDVLIRDQPTGLVNPSEGMLMIPAGDGQLFWLISQNRATFEIQVTRIDTLGIGATTPYDFTDGSTPGFEASHFAFNQDSSQLVMAPRTANRNVWLMNFDPTSGLLTFDRTLTGTGFNDGAGESLYDLEWSPDGSKLYMSRFGGGGTVGQLYQLDFNDTTQTVNPVLPAPVFRSYGLKRAIDDRIYHLYQEVDATSPFTLGRINRPDSIVDSVNYQSVVFMNDFNSTQFPEFTPGYDFTFDTLNFYWIDSCETNVTKFFPIVEPVPNSLRWDFGDGSGSSNWIPNYTYQGAGGFMVSLTAEVGGVTQTITQPVEILANSLMVNLGNDTTICVDEVLTLDAGTGDSYVWSTGETSQTIQVDTTGTYWVEVTDGSGCTDFDDIEVLEYGVTETIANQWYFGEQAGIDFNNGGAIAILDANNQDAEEGCATISDINGDLLFYTNGVTVWNRDHDVMLNGDQIGGDQQSAQNALIMPFGGDETMFYIFTTEQVYGDDEYALRYSIVDMKADTAMGGVVVKNIKLMENSTERVTAIDFTGNDVLMAHEFGNNMFRAYETSQAGLSGAIFSPAGEVHDFMDELSATGYMKISPSFNTIAVNIPGTSQVEILDFDQGVVSNPRLIDTGEADLYGLEYSPGATRLYLTTSSPSSKLIQYDLDSLNSANPAADIQATKFDGYPQGPGYGALQLDPQRSTIYMAVDNSGTIGTISSPELDDAANGFDAAGFDLLGRTSRLGLPNFAQQEDTPNQEPSISVTAGCAGQPSDFRAVGRDPNNSIENYLWVFGDGTSAAVQDTTHTYDLPGTYTVQMILSNRCDVDTTLTTTITVNNIPESPTVPTDTALCDQPIVLTALPVDNPDFTYYWSTGENTREITVNDPAIIDVAIINTVTGCTSDTLQVFLADARPSIDLGGDRIICQNDPVQTLDAQVVNATYAWAIDGVVSGANRTFDIDTTTAGIFEYTVAVTNSFGCIGRDTIQVNVQPRPDVTPSVINGTCGNNDGQIILTFNDANSYSYELSGTGTFGPANFDGPGSAPAITGLASGNYTLLTTNLVTGCTRTEVVQVEDNGGFGLDVTSTGICENQVELTLTGTTPSLPADYNYVVQDDQGNVVASGNNESADPLIITGLDPGTLSVQVTDNNAPNCIETEQEIVNAGAEPAFTFDAIQEFCGTTDFVTITDGGSPGVSYSWTTIDGNIITTPASGTSIEVNQSGTYTVTASGAGFCDRIENIQVNFNTNPVVDVTTSGDPCEGQITLIANVTGGSGTYVFSWNDGSQAAQNTVTTSGTYNVTVTDQFTGCVVTSSDVPATVEAQFEVTLSIEPNCENNEQVFVIATTNYFDPSITYQWQDGSGSILANSDSILTVNRSDRYTVIATNETGTCLVSDAINVAVVPINPEDLLLPERAAFCSVSATDPTVTLDPGIFNTYEWRLLPDQTIISTDQTLQVSTEGTYEVTLYNGFTCITDQVQVVEDCRPIIFAPNAFSPNGNGVNDEFFVFPNDFVDTFEILIYTRWGELVFRSENQDFRWNGVYKGKVLPPGTYAYIMKFSSDLEPELGTLEQYGSVTLIR